MIRQLPFCLALFTSLPPLAAGEPARTRQGDSATVRGLVLDKQKLLDAQAFWDNRDWDWYKANIPFWESPDPDIDTTYYYRWELLTKHLTYGSPATGYTFTEFIDRPFWSGTYGAISCPAGHQLAEARWLKDARIARDYARYWFRTPGAEPRKYSTWLAHAIWGVHQVHPDAAFLVDLLPDLVRNYEGWERSHFVPEVGLFWQTGHDDGMEININSRQTRDEVRGAPGYRPTLNSYLWADARAIAKVARLAADEANAAKFAGRADGLKKNFQEKLWDPKRRFFFPMARQDEERDGHVVKAGTLTYQSGRYAGDPHGRELIGYVPWMFGLPDTGYESAWGALMDRDRFFADFGPTVTERHDPLFLVTRRCCVWSGQSWPYATTQTLVALASLLNDDERAPLTKQDYVRLLRVYARAHRKDGRPYIAEGANPDTGSWEGYDSHSHSEHYFHSGYADLIITGLAGLRPRDDDVIEVNPLVPDDWAYFALDDVAYRGRRVAIVWDKDGSRYGLGAGLRVLADGRTLVTSPTIRKLTAELPPVLPRPAAQTPLNYAVNNDGTYYPRTLASHTSEGSSLVAVNDGNYWYHASPPNRWTTEGSLSSPDWCAIDFGIPRRLHSVKLYLLDDGDRVATPARIELEFWDGKSWAAVPGQSRSPAEPTGHRANTFTFPALETARIRAVFTHRGTTRTGLTEFEAWGDGPLPVPPAPPPAGNLAVNPTGKGYPIASASHTSPYDRVTMANDGITFLRPHPHNRWTAFGSPNATDWLEIDFGAPKVVGRVDLHIYDDRGGVQVPASYDVQSWDGRGWIEVPGQTKSPPDPAGGRLNRVTFPKVETSKVRVVFTHKGRSRSGVSEVEIWRE
jgi:hypothetical protein